MKHIHKQIITGTGIILLLVSTAFAASYITQRTEADAEVKAPIKQQAKTHQQPTRAVAAAAPVEIPRCNDSNILGTVAGGAAGGIAGNQLGKGSGNTAATIVGTLGGAYLGNQYIPLNNATCR